MNSSNPISNQTGNDANGNGNGHESSALNDPALHQRLRAVTRDFNPRELAELTGVSLETARRYLEGKGPGVAFIKKLCEALGISADWLLLGRGAPLYRSTVPLGQMDTSIDEVLDGLGRYLKRLHMELARGGTGLHQELVGGGPAGIGIEPKPGAVAGPQPASVVSEADFADPFDREPHSAAPAAVPGPTAERGAKTPPVQARLVLGPGNGAMVVLPPEAPSEILVRVDAQGHAEIAGDGSAGTHVYRRVFDRVYRWVGSPRSP